MPKGETGRSLELAKRHTLDAREEVALEGGQIDEGAVLFVPFAGFALALDVRISAPGRRGRAMCRILASGPRLLDRREPGAVERLLVLLPLVVRQTVVAIDAVAAWERTVAAFTRRRRSSRRLWPLRGASALAFVAG